MKLGWLLGLAAALALHLGFLLFGGILFPGARADHGTLREVELLGAEPVAEEPPDQAEAKDHAAADEPPPEELETVAEAAPDVAEVMRSLDSTPNVAAPTLDAMSLRALEAALSGQTAAGSDFASSVSFASGGRIGGTGSLATASEDALESAFGLEEIDQEPRAILQTAPVYPAELRGKKLEGVVTLIFIVDAQGKVVHPKVASSTHPAFEKPALDAIRQWKFEPGLRGGERVDRHMRLPIRFQPN